MALQEVPKHVVAQWRRACKLLEMMQEFGFTIRGLIDRDLNEHQNAEEMLDFVDWMKQGFRPRAPVESGEVDDD